jgi:acyl-CoA hydrolase
VASAYLTFVAVDSQGRKVTVPGMEPQGDEEKRRFEDAGRRRAAREQEQARRKAANTPAS